MNFLRKVKETVLLDIMASVRLVCLLCLLPCLCMGNDPRRPGSQQVMKVF